MAHLIENYPINNQGVKLSKAKNKYFLKHTTPKNFLKV